MSKKIIGIVAAIVVAAGLAVTLVLLNRTPLPTDSSSASTPTTSVVYAQLKEDANVDKMVVTGENGSFTIVGSEAGDGSWAYALEGLEHYTPDSTLAALARSAIRMAARSVANEEGDLATYGLASPAVTAQVEYSDGTSATIKVGNAAPGGVGYYVNTGGDTVYLVTSSTIAPYFKSIFEFLDKTVTLGTGEEAFVESAELGGTVRPIPIVIEPAPEDETTILSVLITSPIQANLDTHKGLERLGTAYGIVADAVVAADPDDVGLEAFGLLEPYSTIAINDVELGSFSLSASAPDDDGNVYLMRDGSGLVYQVKADVLGWLEAQAYDLMSKLAVLPYIDSISKITVAAPGESHVFELAGEKDDLVVTYRGETLNTDAFRSYYSLLLSARFDGVVDLPAVEGELEDGETIDPGDGETVTDPDGSNAAGDGGEAAEESEEEAYDALQAAIDKLIPPGSQPLLSYTYEYRNGKAADVVEFFSGPPRKVYIVLNGGTPYLMPRAYIETIIPSIETLLAGEEVPDYIF